ncbi:MAG: DNA/RNA nuclease SfsA [Rhodobacterales bacterium]|nr:MAG: DNA/RNA nuclease SfsA [Rhodobacterales bacterium]
MRFATPLVPARLLRRYKRFLADVRLDDGREVTAHCPNPGAMIGLADADMRIWLEPNDDPKKKLKFGWRLTELPGCHLAGIDTSVPNRVIGEALRAGAIPELQGDVRAEVPYGTRSRVDFTVGGTFVEVKNVHLRRDADWAEFPDCVTARGLKHLEELSRVVQDGGRAVMLYLVQRTDCGRFRLAADLDPAYATGFERARAAGVEVLCYGTQIDREGVTLGTRLPVDG